MILSVNCANCGSLFELGKWQLSKLRRGQTRFVCSIECRGQLGKKIANEKFGLKPLSLKKLARSKVRGALDRGVLAKAANCEECGISGGVGRSGSLQAHHFMGYKNPLMVKWICAGCHGRIDASARVRGASSPNSKLNAESVRAIRGRLSDGVTLLDTASEFSVSKKTILNIKQNKIWRHVQ